MSNRKDVRAAISGLLDAGETPTAVAAALNVARTTVYRVKKKKKLERTLSRPGNRPNLVQFRPQEWWRD